MGLDAEITSVITGLIILVCACSGYILQVIKRIRNGKEEKA